MNRDALARFDGKGAFDKFTDIGPTVAYCTCVFGLIKMKFRRLIALMSVMCCSVLRGRRLI
jgi:hypothetical protein